LLRFTQPRWESGRRRTSPTVEPKPPTTPFSERPPLPELVVVVDNEILDSIDERKWEPRTLLGGLLAHEYVQLYRYSDEGPPDDAVREQHPLLGETIPGWLVAGPFEPTIGGRPVAMARPGVASPRGILGNAVEVAAEDVESPAYAALDPDEAHARRVADAIAVQAADVAHADLFITERDYLHAVTWPLVGDVLVARPEEALLPAGWRWFSACVQQGVANDHEDEQVIFLAQSLLRRFQRALMARDEALRALNKPQDNDTAEEALGNVDLVALALMAAVDVSAGVAHRVLGFPEKDEKKAKWQDKTFRSAVAVEAPEVAALFKGETANRLRLNALGLLRNSIHGEALDALRVSEAGRTPDRFLIGLPHRDADRLVQSLDKLGGRDAWGIEQLWEGRMHADPGLLIDQLIVQTAELLNDVMASTPVERLANVDEATLQTGPPDDDLFGGRSHRPDVAVRAVRGYDQARVGGGRLRRFPTVVRGVGCTSPRGSGRGLSWPNG